MQIPRLDEGNFEGLTITGQLEVVERAVEEATAPVTLVGSSLGGYLAALYASRHSNEVESLILMAPAFHFGERFVERFSTAEMEEWKRAGSRPFFHYGDKVTHSLGYGFVEDAARYPAEPDFPHACLILHGKKDDVVPPQVSEEFARNRPKVTLRLFPSGHELTDVVDDLWDEIRRFQNL